MNKILKLIIDSFKIFKDSTKEKCNVDFIKKVYKTRLITSVIKEKIRRVPFQMTKDISSNNYLFDNISTSTFKDENITCENCMSSTTADELRNTSDPSMYSRFNIYVFSNNFLYYNPCFGLSLLHNSVLLNNCIQKNQYFHIQRDGNPRKKKDKNIMALRLWENAGDSRQSNTKPGFIFTIMSYNVLAQDLLKEHPELYRFHDQGALDWNIRWNNIFEEIRTFYPDILCLQEVQESHVNQYFDQLKSLGYKSIYKKRTGIRVDGCAIYYKTDNIHLLEYTEVEYFQPPVPLLNRDNVGLVVKFAPKLHPTREFIVSTTHLLYNPRRDDVRMAQIQLLLAEIDRICFKYGSRQTYVPVIITGDFNTFPESDLYRLLIDGELKYEELSPRLLNNESKKPALVTSTLGISDSCKHVDSLQKKLSNVSVTSPDDVPVIVIDSDSDSEMKPSKQKEVERIELNREIKLLSKGTLSHDFAFKSVYNHGGSRAVEATTYQDEWVTVDYIFYSTKKEKKRTEDRLKLLARYRLPTNEELSGVTIPNRKLGSDHLSLIAKFKLEF